jgi:beta-lactamase class A
MTSPQPLPRPWRLGAAAALLFAAGVGAGWLLGAGSAGRGDAPPGGQATRLIRGQDDSRWRFISPLLECETAEEYLRQPAVGLSQAAVREFVEQRVAQRQIASAAVYFRQLHDGPWFGVNLRDEYLPASLLKLPTLIAVLKRAESSPGLLEQTLVFEAPDDLNRLMINPPDDPLRRGRSYTVEALCRRMARYSDNNAARLLGELLTPEELDRTLLGLGVRAELQATGGRLNAKSLSGFFRVLYNASYLGDEMSELALEMLSHSSFRKGILAGIPDGVSASSKYGEAWVSAELHQLHEFAIVYYEDRPYLLGVMTQGREYAAMKAFIRDLSRMVYAGVDTPVRPADTSLPPP